MKYMIFTLGHENRKHYVEAIEKKVTLERVDLPAVDGYSDDLPKLLEARGLLEHVTNHPRNFRVGQLGIWLGVLNALEWVVENNEELLTFQDDALLHKDFMKEFDKRYQFLPKDYDFFSLFTPRDHHNWYWFSKRIREDGSIINGQAKRHNTSPYAVNKVICKVYQKYGGVSILYSPAGAKKMLDIVEEHGMLGTYDEHLYANERLGRLSGYISVPSLQDLVYITGKEVSTIGQTKFFKDV